MKLRYVYMIKQKSTGIPVQECFLSREESREAKRTYEQRDGTKYSIVRFQQDGVVR